MKTKMAVIVILLCVVGKLSAQEEGSDSQLYVEETLVHEEGDETQGVPVAPEIDYTDWNTILATYINAEGRFDYAGLMGSEAHMGLFEQTLQQVASATVSQWEEDDQLAFWINAYNVLTVKGVIDNFPLESVLGVTGFFDGVFYQVAGESLTLNDIENERIRAVFNEPRIHFAVNCASKGCPPLRVDAFEGALLENQLEEQAMLFIQRTTRVDSNTMEIHISKLFEWFNGDFQSEVEGGGVRRFLSRYLDTEEREALTNEENRLVYEEYDWTLNAP